MAERILVIEDDRNILDMLTEMLSSAGYEVIALAYPDLALEVVGHERPDLILMDVMLPKRSGIEVADQLWINGFGTIPMVGISASTVMVDLARQSPFFAAVVLKPFEMDQFLRLVHETLAAYSPTAAVERIPAERM